MQTPQTEQVFVKPDEVQTPTSQQVNQKPRPNTKYYHSDVNHPITYRRYTAGGQLLEEDGKYYILLAYSVCSELDQFTKVRGIEHVNELFDQGKTIKHPISAEEVEHWGKVFLDVVMNVVPASTLPKEYSWKAFYEIRKHMREQHPDKQQPTSPSDALMLARPPQKKLDLATLTAMMQQASTSLGLKNNNSIAEA